MATNFTSTGVAIGGDRVTAHAWAHFDSTGTPAIQDDFGFASIADVAAGRCTLTYDTDPGTYNLAAASSQGASSVNLNNCLNEDNNGGTGLLEVLSTRWDDAADNTLEDVGKQRVIVFAP
jgi:hypothetical protein|tara:strand:+ start:1754 stop:2113 length:360 start_codon:yes stop_codon:yes gene_type:complete